jgi:hypothetical protein
VKALQHAVLTPPFRIANQETYCRKEKKKIRTRSIWFVIFQDVDKEKHPSRERPSVQSAPPVLRFAEMDGERKPCVHWTLGESLSDVTGVDLGKPFSTASI